MSSSTGFLVAVLSCSIGCGSGLWFVTPRPEITYHEVSRTSSVQVTTTPASATLFVDGAESATTPRTISVAHKELRRQRRQAIWPALIGAALDLVAFSAGTLIALENNAPEVAIAIGAVGAGVLTLDFYLISGRSVVEEGIETLPVATTIGVRAPGFHDAARTVRVPDITRLHFDLVPATQPAPPPSGAPQPPAPPATAPPPAPTRP